MATIRPNGIGRVMWSTLKSPSEWREGEIPSASGVYERIAVDINGDKIAFPIAYNGPDQTIRDRMQRYAGQMHGVIYVGKASDLSERFGNLASTWASKTTPSDSHGSRKKWDLSSSLQLKYPCERMMCRYLALGSDMSHVEIHRVAPEFKDVFFPEDARKSDNPQTAVATVEENRLFREFGRCFGAAVLRTDGPLCLNTDDEKGRGEYFSDAALKAYLDSLDTPLDPDDDVQVRMLNSHTDVLDS